MEQFESIRTQFGDHILWIEMREPYKGKMASGSNVLALARPDSSLDKRETDRDRRDRGSLWDSEHKQCHFEAQMTKWFSPLLLNPALG